MVTGRDLVVEQIRMRAVSRSHLCKGRRLEGHASNCRINAEDAERKFMPCPVGWSLGPPTRTMSASNPLLAGYRFRRSMIRCCEMIVHGADRATAMTG